MPELPEVETIKNDLNKLIIGRKILDVRSEFPDIIKMDFDEFKKEVVGSKITDVKRRAKNLIIELGSVTGGKYLLIHFKMSGHLIVIGAELEVKNGDWVTRVGPLSDPQNKYVRAQFILDDGNQIAFSDLRRFGYIKLIADSQELKAILEQFGPEPLEKAFTVEILEKILEGKKSPIKKVIMDQKNIAGIGNIYADEILFDAKIHPLKPANRLSDEDIRVLYKSIQQILKLALENRGTSTSDYRDASGKRGNYGNIRKVYRKTGEPCPNNCGGKIERISVGGRGTHFCPKCQKL